MKQVKFLVLVLSAVAISWLLFGFSLFSETNIYRNAGADMLSDNVRKALPRVYVPNGLDNTISIIDPQTYQIINTIKVGKEPQHVVPSYDLSTLYVLNNAGNSMTPINPLSSEIGKPIPVDDPYNLYFTPDGQYAIVVSEAHKRLNFYDAKTFKLHDSVSFQCSGLNHMDFTGDGRYAVVTCEFSGQLARFDVQTHQVLGYLNLSPDKNKAAIAAMPARSSDIEIGADGQISLHDMAAAMPGMSSMPQDIRLSPDGRIFYVADMKMNGVHLIDAATFRKIGFINTGIGTHSVYPSRDGSVFYIANRGCMSLRCPKHGCGSVSVLDPVARKVIATWLITGGGSPDMGNVTADGKELWLSGRYDSEVYVIDTTSGNIKKRIAVGRGPHGLTVWPQPGRYSLGHTGNMR